MKVASNPIRTITEKSNAAFQPFNKLTTKI
jgi:hypothetical protein